MVTSRGTGRGERFPENMLPEIILSGVERRLIRVEERFDKVSDHLHSVEVKVSSMDARIDALDKKIDSIESKLDTFATKDGLSALEVKIDTRFDALDSKFATKDDINRMFYKGVVILGILFGGLISFYEFAS